MKSELENESEVTPETPAIYFNIDSNKLKHYPCIIADIDTGEGIRNVGGKEDVYMGVLRSFYSECSFLISNMEKYYHDNSDMFRIKLHGIKNSCNCIGAKNMAERALNLEKLIMAANSADTATLVLQDKNIRVVIKEKLRGFINDMKLLLQNIYRYLEELRTYCMVNDENKEICSIPGIPRETANMLRDAILNMESQDIKRQLDQIHQKKYTVNVEMYLAKLEELLDNFEFDDAISILDYITEQI